MATLKNSLESILSGKIGNVVFVQMDGKTYARGVQDRSKGNWSPKQQLHRKRFKAVNNFCHNFLNKNFRKIWNLASPNGRGYSFFVKANMPVFAMDGSMIDVQMLQLTAGTLYLPRLMKVWRIEGGNSSVGVSWKNDPNLAVERLNDQMMAVSTNGHIYSEIMATGISRRALKSTFELPALHFPPTHVFLFFASKDELDYSPSVCLELDADLTDQ